jgi:segregation and condensation protein B
MKILGRWVYERIVFPKPVLELIIGKQPYRMAISSKRTSPIHIYQLIAGDVQSVAPQCDTFLQSEERMTSTKEDEPARSHEPRARSHESARPPAESGLSLEDLNAAFAEMLSTGDDPYSGRPDRAPDKSETAGQQDLAIELVAEPDEADAGCEITPRTILEAMLFVGSPDNQPVTSERVAGLMRGVRPVEIDDLVRELNEQYDANGCPYRIEDEAGGYKLVLREGFAAVRDKYFGRTRQAKLSPAAVEVLSIIAYNGAQSADDVARMRGRPSGAILAQLVRRQLLHVERDPQAPRKARYHSTPRLLALLGLETLDDLPRGQEVDRG